MIHLKKFESYNLYKSIRHFDYRNGTDNPESYSKSEVDTINSFVEELNSTKKYPKLYSGISINPKTGKKVSHSITISYRWPGDRLNNFLLDIIKGEDYYHYLHDWNNFYKCDDLEGVKECIKEIIENKFKK